jgi:ATP-binding cassette subfamily C protein
MMQARFLRRFLADVLSVVGRRYVLYLALMVVTGLLEAVSLASMVPLLASGGVGAPAGAGGRLANLAVTLLASLGIQPTTIALGLFVLAGLVISTALFLVQAYVGARLQTTYVYRWQQRLSISIFAARWQYFLKRRHGDLINALVTETQRLGGAFYQAGLLLTGVVHSVVFLVVAAALSGGTTVIVLAGAAILFLITRPLIRRAYGFGVGIAADNAALQSLAGELIPGAKLVKATATEAEAAFLLTRTADRLRHHLFANAFDVQVVRAIFDFGTAAMGAGIVAFSLSRGGTDPAVTLVVLALFVRLMPKLTGIQHAVQALTTSLPGVELLQALAAEAEAEAEPVSAAPLPDALQRGPLEVSVHQLHVRYGPVAALAGIDLEIPAGACVALVGGSGAGKSTLVDAVLGLVARSSGTVRINRIDLDELPLRSLRRRIGYMGQDTVLYNASIRENILWGMPSADAAMLDEAVRLAGADAFIAKSQHGYDTPVGDGGGLLSGGERQRLGLARAALGRPGLLILDEATSALDAETERMVTGAVSALKGRTTVILIAHRLSSARIADTIVVMEGGVIVEQGTWDVLMQRRGRLHHLWELQHAAPASVT